MIRLNTRPCSAQLFLRWGRRQKVIIVVIFCLGLLWYYHFFYKFFLRSQILDNVLNDERFVGSDKCPACFGTSLCEEFTDGRVKFISYSRFRFFDFVNVKNVFFGIYKRKDVVLKRLGHDAEWQTYDEKICEHAGLEKDCEVSKAVSKSHLGKLKDKIDVEDVLGMSDLVRCPSRRLLDSIWSTFKNMQGEESEETGEMTPANKIMLMSMINFNPEPLMVEIFPQSQGWPFPSYIGSCGRFVVMDYEGRTLSEFYDAAWSIRINLAYQVFEIAEHFTNNAEDYALYMTDIVAENFAVTKDGDVKLIDIENIIVVDKKMIREDKPENWDQKLASIHDDCVNSPNCLSFSDHDLCTHVEADHNYYAACHSLIASDAWIGSKPGGLLHDIPENIKKNTDLEHLLNECQNPTETNGRFTTAPQLLSLLQKLSNRM